LDQRVRTSAAADGECPVRHCWVAGSVDDAGVKRPGLLVEWRRSDTSGWEGRVIYAAKLRAGESWTVVEEWLPASLLSPGL
jgi:hypothetical protein